MSTSKALLVTGRRIPARWGLMVALVSASISSIALPDIAFAACDAACQSDFVARHNASRTRLNNGLMPAPAGTFQPTANPPLGALTLNNTAAGTAQAYADTCNGLNHSPSNSAFRGPNTGENIYAAAGQAVNATVAVQAWEDESVDYSHATNSSVNGKVVGHYTQLVWANTTAVGCGVKQCTVNSPFGPFNGGQWDLVVCQYTPAGNFVGQKPYVAGVVAPKPPGGPLDADGNGLYDALTDGILIVRYLFNITGPNLTSGALGPGATANTPELALARMNGFRPSYDIDDNKQFDALTDGLLMLRYLFNLTGQALTNGAVGPGAGRQDSATIEPYLFSIRQP